MLRGRCRMTGHLVHMWHILVQVIEAACHGEDRDSNEKDPGQAAHPGAIVQAVCRQEDRPHWQTTLVQLQQLLIVLQGHKMLLTVHVGSGTTQSCLLLCKPNKSSWLCVHRRPHGASTWRIHMPHMFSSGAHMQHGA